MTAKKPPRKDQPTYTPEQWAEALRRYAAVGPRQASRELGISESAIRRHAKDAGLKPPTANITAGVEAQNARIAAKRAKLKEDLLDGAIELLARLPEKHIDFKGNGAQEVEYPKAPAGACQNYAIAIGTLIDKFRLENGESTSRDEVITVDKLDAEIARLAAEVGRRELADTRTAKPAGRTEGPARQAGGAGGGEGATAPSRTGAGS